MELLSNEEIQEALTRLEDWDLVEEKWLQKQFRFDNYLSGINFVQQIGQYAETIQHHPLISIDYKKVTLKISSWQKKGITSLDVDMAEHCNELYAEAEK